MRRSLNALVILCGLTLCSGAWAADEAPVTLSVGLPVEVMRWTSATIAAVDGQRVQIAFMDSNGWRVTEWVSSSQLRIPKEKPAMQTAAESSKPAIKLTRPERSESVNEPLARADYTIGEGVEILWHDKWHPGSILDVKESKFRVNYEGINESWDEWVPATRLRKKSTLPSEPATPAPSQPAP
ncbi:MAG: Tudor-knot domain-containing protein [Verrucomicrobiota bacterium]|nr:Tudor-knot domain-containing protein [Verrucomicrobiota bacterium]